MEPQYLKIPNKNYFSPKFSRGFSSNIFKTRRIVNNFPKTTNYSSYTMSDFYSNRNLYRNKNNLFDPSYSINFFSPKKIILRNNYRTMNSPKSKPKSSSYRKILPSVLYRNKNVIHNKYFLETEKLYHETYQIKKVIKDLENQLFYLSQENLIKDEQLNEKEREINDIINNNYRSSDDGHNEEKNDNDNDNDNNYNELNINSVNSSMGILILKIKKELKNIYSEIKNENFKLDYLKRSLYITKTKELNVESKLLQQQFNKINKLIKIGLDTKNQNDKIMEEYQNLKENINRQEIIISSLENDCMSLEKEEQFLNNQLNNLKNELKIKIEKAQKNNDELNILSIKNDNLNNDKIIKSQPYTTKINGTPITIKSLYTNKLSDLKKNINFYKTQCKYADDLINKLKDQKKKLIDANKNFQQKIKISSNFLDNTTKIKKYQRPQSSIGQPKQMMSNEDMINNLRMQYKSFKDNELSLEKKANIYFTKLQEIDKENEEKEKKEKLDEENQIELGIDENNPYFTDNEDNVPEYHIKFTSSQFNQFTYILFKNFEAKFIVSDEANNKIIIPFHEVIKKYNITKVSYPSKEFVKIVDEFTKVIMTVLNSDNKYNRTITKIFVGALLYNCECDANKLVEYFSILFGYTRNYILEEKKIIEKLKTKYKKQTKKLVECITSYILNDLNSSSYFSLLKMKDILDKNEINLKDKYIEFLFYYMKKFNDPDAKLEDLKFNLLNDIVPIDDTTVHSKAFINDLDKDIELENNENDIMDEDININKKGKKESSIEIIEDNEKKNNNKKINKNINKEINKEIKKDIKQDINNEKKEKNDKNKDLKNLKDDKNNKINEDNHKNDINNKKKNNIDLINDEDKNIDNVDTDNNISIETYLIKDKKNVEDKGKNNNFGIDNNKYSDINKENENNVEKNVDDNDNDIKNEDNYMNNKNINMNIEKNKNDESNNDNNLNNEHKKKNETDKGENIDTGNYENNNKKSNIIKDNKNTKKKPYKKKYKEDEFINENNPDEEKEKKKNKDKDKEEEKSHNNNETNINNGDDSVTEITNEDYKKQIIDSINLIQNGLRVNSTTFNDLMNGVIHKNLINGNFCEYINIEDFNEKIISIGVVLTDLQLSCLCSRFCVSNELRLIDKEKFEKCLEDNLNDVLEIE